MAPKSQHSPALVLQRSPWSETSWILKLLLPEKGVVSVIAKGARRRNSPFASRLEPLSFVEVCLSWIEGREMQVLTEVSILEHYPNLSNHAHASALALSWVELVMVLQIHGTSSSEALSDLIKGFRYLNANPKHALEKEGLLSLRFMAKLADWEGYSLQTDSCFHCGSDLEPNNFHSMIQGEGAFVCTHCSSEAKDTAAEALWLALPPRSFQSTDWPRAESLLLDYLCAHAPKWPLLKTREILLSLRIRPMEKINA